MINIPTTETVSPGTLAKGLGWFSLALGAAELLAPRKLDESIGAGDHAMVTRAFGLREIAAGAGILATRDPTPWVWGRVLGDVLDLAALAPTLSRNNPRRGMAMAAFANVAAITALDIFCAATLNQQQRNGDDQFTEDYYR